MATLVLTTVGTALGGPVGAAIGAALGQVVDHAVLFRPKGREGARLGDLRVQTSSYGNQVPQLFGTMRVAGTVIWATDLRETRSRSGGGKGQPSVTNYSYSASFAVALSARPIRAVKRIWADGNLLRGAAGDFKAQVGAFRLWTGSEGQAVDPLIAAAQGMEATPAHRGIAYALFEDLDLADYGNRIPSLTFEVEADEGAVTIRAIAAALTGGAVGGDDLPVVDGFAAAGQSVAEALGPLMTAYGLALRGEAMRIVAIGDEADAHVARASLIGGMPVEQAVAAPETVPVRLAVRHHDASRDYQAGMQQAVRGGPGRGEDGIELPIVMTAGAARALAEARLRDRWAGRARAMVRCGWDALALAPGMRVTVDGLPGHWRIEEREWEEDAVRLSVRRIAGGASGVAIDVAAGEAVRESDSLHGPTTLMLADLPPLGAAAASAPALVVAASGGSGWRRAALLLSIDGGEPEPVGRSAPRAVMGTVSAAPVAATSLLIDRHSVMEVDLLAADMDIDPTDEAGLAQGRNLCLVGGELMQFAGVERIGAARVRLTELRRGLRGTEAAIAAHGPGTAFLLVETDRLFAVPPAFATPGRMLTARAVGIGDVEPAVAETMVVGRAMLPPGPVHVRVAAGGAGGLRIEWVRRGRMGWRWIDGVDVPLAEESEAYALTLWHGGAVVRTAASGGPAWTYDAAMIAADGAAGHVLPLEIEIRQVGAHGLGMPVRATVAG